MPAASDSLSPKPMRLGGICFIVSILGAMAVVAATNGFLHYGYSLFVGVPLGMGLLTAMLYSRGRLWKWGEVLWLLFYVLMLSAAWLAFCAIEGFVCILMAATLVASFALIAVLIYWAFDAMFRGLKHRNKLHCLAILSLPLAMNWEATHRPTPPMLEQTTTIEVNAPPEVVWQFIPSFPAITDPPVGLLASGVAYPIASEIDGSGVGATRRCIVSTGTMPEVVTAWEPGKKLEFEVKETPPAMVETNPFGEVHAPHLEGYFQARYGRFLLVPLPDGRTRIEGTSWFVHDLWPQWYWEPVTRRTVSQIHTRVLKHIKSLAEKAAASSR